jgi:hypothetical protein
VRIVGGLPGVRELGDSWESSAKARVYAELAAGSQNDKWYILSDKHGILDPDQVIERSGHDHHRHTGG